MYTYIHCGNVELLILCHKQLHNIRYHENCLISYIYRITHYKLPVIYHKNYFKKENISVGNS